MVQVKDWRANQNGDAGSLEVESFVPGQQEGREVPFYNELTMAAVQAQVTCISFAPVNFDFCISDTFRLVCMPSLLH